MEGSARNWLARCIVVVLGLTMAGLPAAASAQERAHASIVGGGPVAIESLPSLAYVQGGNASTVTSCTGAVVSPRVILTAAHCLLEDDAVRPADRYLVVTGDADLRSVSAENVFEVVQTVVYPGFDLEELHGDAGLLILSRSTGAPPLRMAAPGDLGLLAAGTPVVISGWGMTGGEAPTSSLLQAAETAVQGPAYCRRSVAGYYFFFSPQVQLCAINPPSYSTATCHGDSGGPVIGFDAAGSPVEVGITSLGDPECSTYEPNVFTRVDRISSWVSRWIAAVEQGAPPPPATVPRLRLPSMSITRAKSLVSQSLADELGSRWIRGRGKRVACERIEREKVKCGVSWWQGANDYWGTVTVYFLQEQGIVYWNDRYKIHFVNDYCWWRSGHRQTCVIRTLRR